MTGNRALLTNFVEKFLGTVHFGNNDFVMIAGYGDVVIGPRSRLSKVYMLCSKRRWVDLLIGDRSSKLYTIALNEVASNSSTCLLAKASSSQSWLWHQRLSHLNFATINNLVKKNLVQGLPKMKFEKDHLCSAYEQGKIHRKHHKSKTAFASNKPLYLLHMDLCEASKVIISFIKKTQVNLQLHVQCVRTDNGTKFKNKTLAKFFDEGLEVAFRNSTRVVRNEDGVDLLTGDRSSNLYTIALNEVASNSSACLLAKDSSSQSWLWHQRLSHLNFVTINNLVKNNLVQECDKKENSKVIALGMFELSVSQCVSPISMSKSSCDSKNVEIKLKRKIHLDTFSSVRRPKNSGVI
nr:hypothetical protein [Tanacetum cinerariifolium]